MQLIPRSIAFVDGRCVAVGNEVHTITDPEAVKDVMKFPTDHYDFLGPVNPVGNTREEIEAKISAVLIA